MNAKNDNVFLAKSLPVQRIEEHTQKVVENVNKLKKLLKEKIDIDDIFWKYLELAAYMHDMGKFYEGFQKFIKRELDNKNEYPGYNMHSLLSPLFFDWTKIGKEENNKQNNGQNDDYIFWRKIVLSSIVFHHYRHDIVAVLWGNDREKLEEILRKVKKDLKENENKIECIRNIINDSELKEYIENININRIDKILNKTARFLDYIIPPETPLLLPEQLRNDNEWNDEWRKRYILMKGFLMRADHIASNRGDIVIEKGGTINFEEVKGKIKNRINRDENEIWQISKARDTKNKSVILIGSTGIGKTEFAFLWGAGEKIIFTLPMRTMVDQTYNRAKDIFGSDNVGFIHSSSMLKLLDEKDDIEEIELIRSQSQNLSYPFIAATGDQIFTIAFKYPGYEKILSTLSYSRLVIDEVQAYDPIATAAIVKTIEEVHKMGGKFLLMTATLPEYVKEEIVNRAEIDEKNDIEIRYSKEKDNEDIEKHKLHIEDLGTDKTTDNFYNRVKEIVKRHQIKNYLIIVNTVGNAQKLYNEIVCNKKEKDECKREGEFDNFDVLLLHSRMLFDDRKEVLEKIEKVNKENNDKKVILITTQIVEASIDIDFDVLITEIAPLESLIQRMGRVNRNRGEYKEGEGIGDVYILYPWLKNTDRVYKDKILDSSWEVIKEFINHCKNEGTDDCKERKISESKKKEELLNNYYKKNSVENVAKEFKDNLKILDNLYVAENKTEAHKMFRDISSVNVIPENKLNKLKEEVKNIIDKELEKGNIKDKLLKGTEKESKKLINVNFEKLVQKINEGLLCEEEKIDPEKIKNQEQFYLNYLDIMKVLKINILGEIQKYSISLHYRSAVGNIEPLELDLPNVLNSVLSSVLNSLTKGFYVIKGKYTYEDGKGLVRDDGYENKETGTLPDISDNSSNIL